MPSKVWNGITYPLPNFNGYTDAMRYKLQLLISGENMFFIVCWSLHQRKQILAFLLCILLLFCLIQFHPIINMHLWYICILLFLFTEYPAPPPPPPPPPPTPPTPPPPPPPPHPTPPYKEHGFHRVRGPGITVTSWWAWWRLKSPASRLFTQSFVQAQIKENIKAPPHWPLWGEFTGNRWIPRTKGQLIGKIFPFDDVIIGSILTLAKPNFPGDLWIIIHPQ